MADKKYKTYYIEKQIIPIGNKDIKENGIYNVENCSRVHVRVPGGNSVTDLNIHCSTTEPEDTSKLWIKTDVIPNSIEVTNDSPETTEHNLSVGVAHMSKSGVTNLTNTGAVVYKDQIYIYISSSTLNVLDPETHSIKTLAVGIGSVEFATVDGDRILLFTSNSCKAWTPETSTFETLSSSTTHMIEGRTVRVGDKIYSFGNQDGYVYDMKTNKSTELGSVLPKSALYRTVAAVGDKIYLFGGRYDYSGIKDIVMYDPATNTAETLSVTLPYAAYKLGCAVVGSKVYLFGGTTSPFDDYGMNYIAVFDAVSYTTKKLSETLPHETVDLCSCTYKNRIYLFRYYEESGQWDNIDMFTVTVPLEENKLSVLTTSTSNTVTIFDNGVAKVNVGISKCMIGNSENIAEVIPCAVHNGTDWVEI